MVRNPDGGEWILESIAPDLPRDVPVPITRAVLRCGEREVRIVYQHIKTPTGRLYIRTVAYGSEGGVRIRDLPREAKKLICTAYALILLLE
jgi:hypothetical protein